MFCACQWGLEFGSIFAATVGRGTDDGEIGIETVYAYSNSVMNNYLNYYFLVKFLKIVISSGRDISTQGLVCRIIAFYEANLSLIIGSLYAIVSPTN